MAVDMEPVMGALMGAGMVAHMVAHMGLALVVPIPAMEEHKWIPDLAKALSLPFLPLPS